MNVPLIHDAIDLLRLRTAPLAQYQYPLPHLLAAFAALGVMTAAAAHADGASGQPLAMSLFFTLYVLMETTLYAIFMRWWLQRAGYRLELPLIGLVTAANMIKLLDPLASWLPDDVGRGLTMALSAFGLFIIVRALSQLSGASVLRVLGGTLLFAPAGVLLMASVVSVAASVGVSLLPAEVMQAIANGG
ncbi:MAG: hypothetical protein ACK4FZ_09380 [Vogesella sp.]|uniref:hypothetical protein n=1 Tax=Vogesella sp. TaxID=1904252 RepID=UPI00391BB3B6